MSKLAKNMYKSLKTGERRLNCYVISIPKEIVSKTDLEDKELNIYAKDNKIIIEKRDKNG